MASPATLSATARLHAAFSKPLQQRCTEVSQILDGTSTKELHSLLPMLLENIFGFTNQPSWGIDRITKSHYYEFHAIRQLLGPHGPMLRLIYQLMADPYSRYEFPLSCVPFPSMKAIEEGSIPHLYCDKLQFNQVGKPYSMLTLNAFELYFFHFAHFLVNTHAQRTSSWGNPSEALFPTMLEEYLNFFLPLDGHTVPPVLQQGHGVKSPLAAQSPLHRQSPGTPHHTTPLSRLSSLLRSPASPASPVSTHPYQSLPGGSSGQDHSEQETWRSRTFLQILIEFWLNQTFNPMSVERYTVGHSYSSMESFLPTSDHVRVVRMLIKHLHYFANSAKPDVISSPYSSPTVSHWDDFKKMVLCQLVQKQLYAFLRHGFEKWPLDSSFRLILETWLSFIQPWRYTDPSQSNREKDHDIRDKIVDGKWTPFVVENLLFYTVLLQSFLQRCFKLDLSAVKNAYMIFRVSKVFNLPNLRDVIEEAEVTLFHPITRASHGPQDLGASYLSPSHRHHSNVASILNLQFAELEGPGFQYQPLYCDESLKMVQRLLTLMSQARLAATSSSMQVADQSSTSFLDWFGLGDPGDGRASRYDGFDDYGSGSSIKRVETHLEHSINNLCNVFQLELPEKADRSVTWGSSTPGGGRPETLTPDVYDTDDGQKLTPLGRYQMMNGLRKFAVEYQGDPDLQPIRSFESKALVRILYCITSYFNNQYGPQISDLYARTDFLGRVSKQVLHPPTIRRGTPPKVSTLSPSMRREVEQHQSPRLSLRWLASYQNIGYIMALYLFLYMWFGLGPVGFIFTLLCMAAVSAVFKTLFSTVAKKTSAG